MCTSDVQVGDDAGRALACGSATVTLKTYAHLWPSAEDRNRTAAATMLGVVFGRTY